LNHPQFAGPTQVNQSILGEDCLNNTRKCKIVSYRGGSEFTELLLKDKPV
jgi:hypothetical protein